MNRDNWLRWQYTSFVYTGTTREERNSRLAEVPDNIRQYVRERVTALYSFDGRKR